MCLREAYIHPNPSFLFEFPSSCYISGSFDTYIINKEHKDKIINTNDTRGFNVVRPTMPTSTYERESFHYAIENITEDRTRYNYWVLETSHVSSLFVSIPYHEPSRFTGYLSFFLTSLSTSYSFYKHIFISWLFPLIT